MRLNRGKTVQPPLLSSRPTARHLTGEEDPAAAQATAANRVGPEARTGGKTHSAASSQMPKQSKRSRGDERMKETGKAKKSRNAGKPTQERRTKNKEDFDPFRFRNLECARMFEHKFRTRSICAPREFDFSEQGCPAVEIRRAVLERNWQKLCESAKDGYYELTREFYANLEENEDEETSEEVPYTSFVRGTVIHCSAEIFNQALNIPEDEDGRECRYAEIRENYDLEDGRLCYCKPGTVTEKNQKGEAKFIFKRDLLPLPKLWVLFINSTLLPIKHDNEIIVKRMALLHCLMEGLHIDVGATILNEMVFVRNTGLYSLPYCSIISHIVKLQGVHTSFDFTPVLAERAVNKKYVQERILKDEALAPRKRKERPSTSAGTSAATEKETADLKVMMTQLLEGQQKILETQAWMVDKIKSHGRLLNRLADRWEVELSSEEEEEAEQQQEPTTDGGDTEELPSSTGDDGM